MVAKNIHIVVVGPAKSIIGLRSTLANNPSLSPPDQPDISRVQEFNLHQSNLFFGGIDFSPLKRNGRLNCLINVGTIIAKDRNDLSTILFRHNYFPNPARGGESETIVIAHDSIVLESPHGIPLGSILVNNYSDSLSPAVAIRWAVSARLAVLKALNP